MNEHSQPEWAIIACWGVHVYCAKYMYTILYIHLHKHGHCMTIISAKDWHTQCQIQCLYHSSSLGAISIHQLYEHWYHLSILRTFYFHGRNAVCLTSSLWWIRQYKALQAIFCLRGIFTHTFVVDHTLQLIMVFPTWLPCKDSVQLDKWYYYYENVSLHSL